MTTEEAVSIMGGASVVIGGRVHFRTDSTSDRLTLCDLRVGRIYARDRHGTTRLIEIRKWTDGPQYGRVCATCRVRVCASAKERRPEKQSRESIRRTHPSAALLALMATSDIDVLGVLPEQEFDYPSDVGHNHICDMCGLKIFNGYCPYCGRTYGAEDSFEMINPDASFEGMTGLQEALAGRNQYAISE